MVIFFFLLWIKIDNDISNYKTNYSDVFTSILAEITVHGSNIQITSKYDSNIIINKTITRCKQ